MRRLMLVAALLLGACATPKTDKVSLEGPAKPTTTTASTTTTLRVTTTTVPQGPVEVARWSGDTDTDTENFTVDDSWELHWRVSGAYGNNLAVQWTVPGEAFPSDYLMIDTAEGSSLIRAGGTFYLSISAIMSSFEVWVVDVPN